jgi:hypothetical protein
MKEIIIQNNDLMKKNAAIEKWDDEKKILDDLLDEYVEKFLNLNYF